MDMQRILLGAAMLVAFLAIGYVVTVVLMKLEAKRDANFVETEDAIELDDLTDIVLEQN